MLRDRAPITGWMNENSVLVVIGVTMGLVAGLGAATFDWMLREANHLLLADIGGFRTPTAAGEGMKLGSSTFARPWAIPLTVALGGFVSGLLVKLFAPHAAGHGTDAAIEAVHENPYGIAVKTVIVKMVASAITIGSGGSAGREGPTGQISAGFGSLLARRLRLDLAHARIAVTAGIGSGIGAIFGAPLGGTILSTEILYRDDMDGTFLMPTFIASVIAYVVFRSFFGFHPLFATSGVGDVASPSHLLPFVVLGVAAGVVGIIYAKSYDVTERGVARVSERWRWLMPTVGGLLVGLLALKVPPVLGSGYGWLQFALNGQLFRFSPLILLILPFARIVATSLSIGTGGSGGVFGPGMVIGGFLGADVWYLGRHWGIMGTHPGLYVVVGMVALFGSIARAPIAMLVMVAEMTGNASSVLPAMIAVGVATVIVHRFDATIYQSQLRRRSDEPTTTSTYEF